MHTKHGSLRQIDAEEQDISQELNSIKDLHRGTVKRTEDTTVGDREGTAGHVLDAELVVSSLKQIKTQCFICAIPFH